MPVSRPSPAGSLPGVSRPLTRFGEVILVAVTLAAGCTPSSSTLTGGPPSPSSSIARPTSSVSASALASPATSGGAACSSTPSGRDPGPPSATPIAAPPAEPAGDGTTATICTEVGTIVIEVYTESSPVAAENFINLAQAGYYDGVVFHRLVPGFVIQGGDPDGTGRGGPGYTIQDEPVVGDYVRGTVAMARTPEPDSQGSQFFIVLDDLSQRLDKAGGYAIFGRVVEGMEVVDAIAAMPNSGEQTGNQAADPVAMTSVVISSQ